MRHNFAIVGLSPAQIAFISDVCAATVATPSRPDHIVRIHNDITRIDLKVYGCNHVKLIEMECSQPNEGHGRKTLDWLCALADRHRLEMETMAHPLYENDHNLNSVAALSAWYGRRGFVSRDASDYVFRMPR